MTLKGQIDWKWKIHVNIFSVHVLGLRMKFNYMCRVLFSIFSGFLFFIRKNKVSEEHFNHILNKMIFCSSFFFMTTYILVNYVTRVTSYLSKIPIVCIYRHTLYSASIDVSLLKFGLSCICLSFCVYMSVSLSVCLSACVVCIYVCLSVCEFLSITTYIYSVRYLFVNSGIPWSLFVVVLSTASEPSPDEE